MAKHDCSVYKTNKTSVNENSQLCFFHFSSFPNRSIQNCFVIAASEASSDTICDDGFPVLHTIEVALALCGLGASKLWYVEGRKV